MINFLLVVFIKEGLIKEVGRSPETNFRYFDDTTLERLKRIREERLKGKSIKEIKSLLNYELFHKSRA